MPVRAELNMVSSTSLEGEQAVPFYRSFTEFHTWRHIDSLNSPYNTLDIRVFQIIWLRTYMKHFRGCIID